MQTIQFEGRYIVYTINIKLLMTFFFFFFFFLGKINLITLIVVKSIKSLIITKHIVLQDHN
jgi:hypothetical protein